MREHLLKVKEMTGHTPEELIAVEVSDCIIYLWEWFLQLNSGRQNNGMAVSPLSYSEIKAWSELMETRPSAFEISVIKALDGLFIEHMNKKDK